MILHQKLPDQKLQPEAGQTDKQTNEQTDGLTDQKT